MKDNRRNRVSRKVAQAAGGAVVALIAVQPAQVLADAANIFTWTGQVQPLQNESGKSDTQIDWDATQIVNGVTQTNWSLMSTNSSGGVVSTDANAIPYNDGDTQLVFSSVDPAASGHTINITPYQDMGSNFDLNRITFVDPSGTVQAQSFVLSGASLELIANEAGTAPSIQENTAAPQTINQNLVLDSNLMLQGTGTGSVTLGGNLSQTGGNLGLNVSGSATYILTGTNSFTGAVTIGGGKLVATNSSAIPGNSVSVNGSGILDLSQLSSITLNDISGTGSIALGAAILTTGASNASTVFSGSISGVSGSLTKVGTGTLTLAGWNTYTGTTNISAGSLKLTNTYALNQSTLNLGTVGAVIFDSGVYNYVVGGLSGNGNLALQNNATVPGAIALNVGANNVSTGYSGVLSGPGSLAKIGAGNLILSGVSTYSGATSIDAGYLSVATGGGLTNTQISVAGAAALNINGGTVNTGSSTLLIGSAYAPTTAEVDLTAGSLTDGETSLGSQSPAIFNQSGGIHTINGSLYLGVRSASTYMLGGGTLSVNTITPGTGGSTFNFSGGTLVAGASSTSFMQGLTAANVQAGGAIINTGTNNITIAQALQHDSTLGASPDGGLTKLGSGTLTLTGTNTYTGVTNLSNGVLSLGSTGAIGSTGPILFTGGTLQYSSANNTDYSSRFSNASNQAYSIDTNGQSVTFTGGLNSSGGSLTKLGPGTLTLAGPGFFTGDATVDDGTLMLSAGTAPYLTPGHLYVNGTSSAPAVFNQAGGTIVTPEVVVGVSTNSVGTFVLTGGNTVVSGALGFFLGYRNGSTGTALISGAQTSFSDSGEIRLGNGDGTGSNGIGTFNVSGGATAEAGGQLDLATSGSTVNANGASLIVGSLSGVAATTLSLSDPSGGTALTVGSDNTRTTYAGKLIDASGGPGSVTKVGTGNLTLSGHDTFSGALTITGGQLISTAGLTPSSLVVTGGAFNQSAGITTVGTGGIVLGTDGTNGHTGAAYLTGSSTNFTDNGSATLGFMSNGGTSNGNLSVSGGAAATVDGQLDLQTSGSQLTVNNATVSVGSLAGVSGSTISLSDPTGGGYALTVGSGGTSTTFSGVITNVSTGTGSLQKLGTGVLTLGGTTNLDGQVTIFQGTLVSSGTLTTTFLSLQIGAFNQTAGTVTIGNGGASVGNIAVPSFSGALNISGNQTNFNDSSAIVLGTPGPFGGGSVGYLNVSGGATAMIAGQANLTVSASSITANNAPLTVGSLSGVSGTSIYLSDSARNAALTVGSDNTSSTFSGTIADGSGGSGSIIKVGSGSLTLAGACTFTGGLYVVGGTLATTAGLTPSIVEVNAAAFNQTSGTVATGEVDIGADLQFDVGTALITGTNSVLTDAGVLRVGASNGAYSQGMLNVSNGAYVRVASQFALGSSGSTAAISGATLIAGSLSGYAGTSIYLSNVYAGVALTVGADNTNTEYAGTISDSNSGSGSLGKAGTGTLTLSGAGTFTGALIITGGSLVTTAGLTPSSLLDDAGVFNQPSGKVSVGSGGIFFGTDYVPSDTGIALVSGTGTVLNDAGVLKLGNEFDPGSGSTGILNVSNGAAVSVTGQFNLGFNLSTAAITNATLTAGSLSGVAGCAIYLSDPTGAVALTVGSDNSSTGYGGTISNANGGSGSLTKIGTGTLEIDGAVQLSGTVEVEGGDLELTAPSEIGTLKLDTGTAVNVRSNSTRANVLTVSNLSIASNHGLRLATLDVMNNALDLPGASLSTVTSLIASGYAGGNFNGPGITSSTAAANTAHNTAVGVLQNILPGGSPLYTTFEGQPVGVGDILVKYTYYGDANLDGKVDGSDYSLIDNGSLNHLTGWYNGDFNYDGVVNGSDYTLIDNAFNTQGAQISASIAAATAQVTGGESTSAVPEPTTSILQGIVIAGLLGRRRQRQRAVPALL